MRQNVIAQNFNFRNTRWGRDSIQVKKPNKPDSLIKKISGSCIQEDWKTWM
jgi:hypothetical protein